MVLGMVLGSDLGLSAAVAEAAREAGLSAAVEIALAGMEIFLSCLFAISYKIKSGEINRKDFYLALIGAVCVKFASRRRGGMAMYKIWQSRSIEV